VRAVLIAALLVASPALAEHVTVQRGETLEHVAKMHGCATQRVLDANNLDTTLVSPGTIVVVPECRASAKRPPHHSAAESGAGTTASGGDSDDEKAKQALAVIDGAAWVQPRAPRKWTTSDTQEPADSVGEPWNGALFGGEAMPTGEGYEIRRPARSYGAPHVVAHLRDVIAQVRALYPNVHTLAIGDLSSKSGGKLAGHLSHQSGLDVDVGLYFKHMPAGYPDSFAPVSDDLDLEATWALLTALARTADLDDGVHIIFFDYEAQGRLYKWAKAHGTPAEDLDFLLQYPRGKDATEGLVRHWPHHNDHFHVRFKPHRD
jgi:penicillin-insensitive murein endopeptidase